MNKAFVRESDDADDDDEIDTSPLSLPAGSKNYITPTGFERLRAEREYLIKTERPKIVDVVSWAASNGDRSENGDYIYGKKRLREIDRRIRFLTKRIENAEIVDPTRQDNVDQVFFGATVTVIEINNNDAQVEVRYSIVGIDEIDLSRGYISWISPLARALIKAREGDIVHFQSPGGWKELGVISIRYDPV